MKQVNGIWLDTSLPKEEQERILREEEEKKSSKPPSSANFNPRECCSLMTSPVVEIHEKHVVLVLFSEAAAAMPAAPAPGVNVFSRKNSKAGNYVNTFSASKSVAAPMSMLQTLPKSQSVPANIFQPSMGESALEALNQKITLYTDMLLVAGHIPEQAQQPAAPEPMPVAAAAPTSFAPASVPQMFTPANVPQTFAPTNVHHVQPPTYAPAPQTYAEPMTTVS